MWFEGLAPINEDENIPENFEFRNCVENTDNIEWIEETLEKENNKLKTLHGNIKNRIVSVKAKIEHHEHIEDLFSGPRQRELKEALKVLGDVARYHGGNLQGKQVQKLFDDARSNEFNLFSCIKDDKEAHDRFATAVKTLANASDALKLPMEEFDEDDIKGITSICEHWGKKWPVDFPHKSITPKGHILSYVIPTIAKKRKNILQVLQS